MKVQIANQITGEVIEANCKIGLQCIRGCIREWIKGGISPLEIDVLHASGHAFLDEYLVEYAVDTWLDIEDLDDDDDDDDDLEDITGEDLMEWMGWY